MHFDAPPRWKEREVIEAYELRRHETPLLDELYPQVLDRFERATSSDCLHLNLIGSAGIIGLNMFQLRREMHVVFVQPNQTSCNQLAEACQGHDIPYSVLGEQTLKGTGPDTVMRDYVLQNERFHNIDFKQKSPCVWIVNDHVRTAGVIRAMLGERKADSASIVFTPKSLMEIRESPYSVGNEEALPDDEIASRTTATVLRREDNALALADEYVRPGGRLLMAQLHPARPGVMRPPPGTLGVARVNMGTHEKYWSSDPTVVGRMIDRPSAFPNSEAQIFTLVRRDLPV